MRPMAIAEAAPPEPTQAGPGGAPPGPLEALGTWLSGYPDSRALRFVHKLPLTLWRLGLGSLLGSQLMLLTTTGARTGLPRTTGQSAHHVDGKLYAWCPYGARSAWFGNLVADPAVTVQTSAGTWTAEAARLEDEQEARRLYRHLREFDLRMLREYLAGQGIPDSEIEFAAARGRLHVVRLDRAGGAGPQGLSHDLVWVWAALGVASAAALLLGKRASRRGRAGRFAQAARDGNPRLTLLPAGKNRPRWQ